nr:uncharacterized protein LOC113403771 [Vanessa tameamea]
MCIIFKAPFGDDMCCQVPVPAGHAQSIPAHYPDLLSSFGNSNIHAILISETFLEPSLPSSSFSLPNFHLIRNDRTGKGGGGVAIYLRNHIPFTILNKSDSQYSESAEHILIEVIFGHIKVLLGVFYSPSLHIDYFDTFESLLENSLPNVNHAIIMGDFNTCLIKNDARAKRLLNIINSSNLNFLPSNATHYFPNCIPSQLDLSFVSSLEHVEIHGQLPAEAFSYHDLIYLSYKVRPPKVKPTVVMRRSFKHFDNEKFMQDLSAINWDSILNASTIDEKLELFNSSLNDLFDKHAPFRPIKLKHLPAPWLSQDIRKLMKKRDRAKSKFKLNPTIDNLVKYKSLRNRCRKVCRDAQRKYIQDKIENSNSSQTWKFLQSLGIGRQASRIPHTVDLNALNGFFASTVLMNNSDIISIGGAIERLNQELHKICTWSKTCGLLVNPDKSQVIIIGSSKLLTKVDNANLPAIIFNNTPLSLSSSVKNLGLLIDNTLSWTVQVAETNSYSKGLSVRDCFKQ